MRDEQNPIAKLETVDTRLAWAHEANDFTPWLAENLEHLGEAVGMSLELEGIEVSVEQYSADILARNIYDDSRVLIENQLAPSDHTHLGQILTYLAGLEANTVIWIAADFKEPHLSAINWLNSNTDDSISFFAIKLKVVRIGDSPFAPVFDVMARPNNWEKRLHQSTANTGERSALSQQRFEFWQAYVNRIAGEEERNGPPSYLPNRHIKLENLDLLISLFGAKDSVGLFVRAINHSDFEETRDRLSNHRAALETALDAEFGKGEKHWFVSLRDGDYTDVSQRFELIDWINQSARKYEKGLLEILGD